MSSNARETLTMLPKPILDRINRYTKEGRTLEASYDREYCSLLAVANWQRPAVILRSSTNSFTQMRSAVETEWTRAVRKHRTNNRLIK